MKQSQEQIKAEGFCLLTSNAISIYCIFCIKFIKLSPFSYSLDSFFSLEVPFIYDFFNFPYFFARPAPFLVVWQIGIKGKGSKVSTPLHVQKIELTRVRPRIF